MVNQISRISGHTITVSPARYGYAWTVRDRLGQTIAEYGRPDRLTRAQAVAMANAMADRLTAPEPTGDAWRSILVHDLGWTIGQAVRAVSRAQGLDTLDAAVKQHVKLACVDSIRRCPSAMRMIGAHFNRALVRS